MKILSATLAALCLCTAACSKDATPPTQHTGTVGQGLGGQTVGTPYSGSAGAGSTAASGPGSGSNTSRPGAQ